MKKNSSSDSLVKRIGHWMFLVLIIIAIACFFLLEFYLIPSIREQEMAFGSQLSHQIRATFEDKLKSLHATATNLAEWDFMYAASKKWTQDFEKSAFPETIFYLNCIDLLAVMDENGEILCAKCRRSEGSKETIYNYEIDPYIRNLMSRSDQPMVDGLYQSSLGAVFITSSHILKSDGSGPSRGRLLVGRLLGPRVLKAISDVLGHSVYSSETLDPRCKLMQGGNSPSGKECYAWVEGGVMVISTPMRDYSGKTILFVNGEIKRSVFTKIYNHSVWTLVVSLLIYVLAVIVVLYILDKIALRRIRALSALIVENTSQADHYRDCPENGHDEINVLQQSYNQMLRRIQQEEEKRLSMEKEMIMMTRLVTAGKVTASILHEVSNPIRVLKNCLYAMDKDPNSSPKYLELLQQEVKNLGAIMDQLTDFSHIEKGEPLHFLVRDVLVETVFSVQTALPADHTCVISLNGEERPMRVKGNPSKARQVFFNIIKNACEAVEFSGNVNIEIRSSNGWVQTRINDEGPGVDTERLDTIYLPFYSTKKAKGMGLGLSIAYSIVASYGWKIWVDKEYFNGACFVIEMPLEEETPA